jgi:hypothetical protein
MSPHIWVLLILAAFAVGKYSNSGPEYSEVIKYVDREVVVKDKEVKTVVTEVQVKEPDGKETKTTITETESKTITTKEKSELSQSQVTITPTYVDQYYVQVMAGVSKDNLVVPFYGASVSRKILGPFTLGVFGLTNMTGGVSLGVSF